MNNAADEKRKELQQRIMEFRNRKIYTEFDPEILASIPDEKLEQAILDYVIDKSKNPRTELADISRLSAGFQIVYSTMMLEAEVDNGGFNQYFFNSSGKFADIALRSLKELNAVEYIDILQNAMAVHAKEKGNALLQKLFARRSLQAFSDSYKLTSLDECDRAFYAVKTDLSQLRISYIREHPDLFIGD